MILYALHVYDAIKRNLRNRERPRKIFINGQDDADIKHYCQQSGLQGTREPKLVVEIDKVPIYLDPNLEQGYAAYQMTSEQSPRRISVLSGQRISAESGTEEHHRGNMILSGGRLGKYRDTGERIAATFKRRIRSALELLKRAPTTLLNKVGNEIRWLWRTSIKRP